MRNIGGLVQHDLMAWLTKETTLEGLKGPERANSDNPNEREMYVQLETAIAVYFALVTFSTMMAVEQKWSLRGFPSLTGPNRVYP